MFQRKVRAQIEGLKRRTGCKNSAVGMYIDTMQDTRGRCKLNGAVRERIRELFSFSHFGPP